MKKKIITIRFFGVLTIILFAAAFVLGLNYMSEMTTGQLTTTFWMCSFGNFMPLVIPLGREA